MISAIYQEFFFVHFNIKKNVLESAALYDFCYVLYANEFI